LNRYRPSASITVTVLPRCLPSRKRMSATGRKLLPLHRAGGPQRRARCQHRPWPTTRWNIGIA
jgi:hypothetical protein